MAAAASRRHGTLGPVRPPLGALFVVALLPPAGARGEPRSEPPHRDLCGRGVRHRGAPIDLDLKAAAIHDAFRLLADVGRVNIVVPDDVTGAVTLRLTHVAWDAAACAIAGVHRLRIDVYDDNILVVTRAAR
jgi:hypothetical protein